MQPNGQANPSLAAEQPPVRISHRHSRKSGGERREGGLFWPGPRQSNQQEKASFGRPESAEASGAKFCGWVPRGQFITFVGPGGGEV